MNLNKIMCYCFDRNSDGDVTLQAIINRMLHVIATFCLLIIITLLFGIMAVQSGFSQTVHDMALVPADIKAIGILALAIILILLFAFYLYDKSENIKIAKCKRTEKE